MPNYGPGSYVTSSGLSSGFQSTSAGAWNYLNQPAQLTAAQKLAETQAQSAANVAGIQGQTAKDVAASQLSGQLAGYGSAEKVAAGQLSGQLAGYGSQEKVAAGQLSGQLAGYGSQEKIAGTQAQTQLAGYQTQKDIAQTQAQAAEYGPALQQARFNTVFPYIQSQISSLTGGGGYGSSGYTGQGNSGAGSGQGAFGYSQGGQPYISDRPVYTGHDIQSQVNSQRAGNDAATAGQVKSQQESLSGRGFSSRSPLSQALGTAAWGQNLATNTANEQQTRWNAAQGNAQQRLSAQQAQEAQYSNRQQEAIKRQQVAAQQQSALLSALAGLT